MKVEVTPLSELKIVGACDIWSELCEGDWCWGTNDMTLIHKSRFVETLGELDESYDVESYIDEIVALPDETYIDLEN